MSKRMEYRIDNEALMDFIAALREKAERDKERAQTIRIAQKAIVYPLYDDFLSKKLEEQAARLFRHARELEWHWKNTPYPETKK